LQALNAETGIHDDQQGLSLFVSLKVQQPVFVVFFNESAATKLLLSVFGRALARSFVV